MQVRHHLRNFSNCNQYYTKMGKFEQKKAFFLIFLSPDQIFFVPLRPILEVESLWEYYGRVRYRPQRN